jgi:hypothetical protein
LPFLAISKVRVPSACSILKVTAQDKATGNKNNWKKSAGTLEWSGRERGKIHHLDELHEEVHVPRIEFLVEIRPS